MDVYTTPLIHNPPSHHHHQHRRKSSHLSDSSTQDHSIQQPQPAYHSKRGLASPNSLYRSHDSVISQPKSPQTSFSSSSRSMSLSREETHNNVCSSPGSSTQPQGVLLGSGDRRYHLPIANAGDVDIEKAAGSPRGSRRSSAHKSHKHESDEVESEDNLEDKAVSLLVYLSFLCPFVSFGTVLWTVLALTLAIICLPLRLFTYPASTRLGSLLSPILRFQLGLIHSSLPSPPSSSSSSSSCSTPLLLLVTLASPFVSFGIALAAWTVGTFWLFSAILGDPAGKDGHNDGRASVLKVRGWWEGYLLSCMRRR